MEAHFCKVPQWPRGPRELNAVIQSLKAELSSLQTPVIIKLMALKMCLDIKSIFHRGAGLIKTAVWQLMMNLSLAELSNWNRPVHPSPGLSLSHITLLLSWTAWLLPRSSPAGDKRWWGIGLEKQCQASECMSWLSIGTPAVLQQEDKKPSGGEWVVLQLGEGFFMYVQSLAQRAQTWMAARCYCNINEPFMSLEKISRPKYLWSFSNGKVGRLEFEPRSGFQIWPPVSTHGQSKGFQILKSLNSGIFGI